MLDVLCIALTALFFGVNVAFAAGCDRLVGSAVQTGYRRPRSLSRRHPTVSAIAAKSAQGVYHKGRTGAQA